MRTHTFVPQQSSFSRPTFCSSPHLFCENFKLLCACMCLCMHARASSIAHKRCVSQSAPRHLWRQYHNDQYTYSLIILRSSNNQRPNNGTIHAFKYDHTFIIWTRSPHRNDVFMLWCVFIFLLCFSESQKNIFDCNWHVYNYHENRHCIENSFFFF